NSLSMGDEHLDTISATESDEVIKSSVEDLVPILREISSGSTTTHSDISLSEYDSFIIEEFVDELAHIISPPEYERFYFKDLPDLVEEIEDDNLGEKLLNVYLLIANIEALKNNPTQSSELLTKSSSTSFNSLLEETNTFHNSLSEFENFYFDLEEISSGSTTTHSDRYLPDYEPFSFDDDHIKEISSGSTTTHSNISLSEYDSFIFDLTHEEFVDELAHIICLPEYDRFYFRNLPDQGELMSVLNSGIREKLSTTLMNLPIELVTLLCWHMLYGSFLLISRIPLFLFIFTHSGMKILSLTQASLLIIFIHLSLVHLSGIELSRNSILTAVT
nr:hypothetical protein [Tanacetum cinerariifolium]